MKNKILYGLALMLLLCACVFAFTACGGNEPPHTQNDNETSDTQNDTETSDTQNDDDTSDTQNDNETSDTQNNDETSHTQNDNETSHTHNYSTLKFDEGTHWFECVCGDKDGIEAHKGGTASCTELAVCSVCNESYGELEEHNHATLKNNNTAHWYECTCGDKATAENHKGGTATCTELAVCSICDIEYGEYVAHPYESKWIYNETYHWHEPTCNCDIKGNFEQHTLEESGWCSVCGQAILPTNGIYYEVSADGTYAEVIAYLGTSKEVNIASTYNGAPVTSICSNAFKDTSITTVIIPDSVTSIGSYAFSECSGLSSVGIGNGVTSIGDYAFNGCRNLINVKIGNRTTSIGDYAFYNCKNLSSIEIPDSVTSIGSWAFYGCTSLTSVEISDNLSSIGYSAFRACSNLMIVVIPDNVIFIDSFAFSNCSALTSFTIPYGVRYIGRGTFFDCSNITSVIIPDTVTSIYPEAFYGCDSLTSITIPDSVTSIGENAFYGCVSLAYNTYGNVKYLGNENNPYLAAISTVHTNFTNYELCEQTKVIAGGAFKSCARLTNIDIPYGVRSIGECAFYNCTSLADITIPNGVKSIGSSAFYNCTSLKSIIIPDATISIGSYAFENSAYYNDSANWENGVLYIGKHLIKANSNIYFTYSIKEGTLTIASFAFSGRSLTRVTIPDSLTLIGSYAFDGCKLTYNIKDGVKYLGNSNNPYLYLAGVEDTSITTITIDSNCKIIGDSAFYGCDKLTSITISDSVISISNNAFDETGYYNDERNWNNGVLYIGKHPIAIKTPSLGV